MSARTLQITPALYDYLMQVGVRESPTAAALRVETQKLPMAMMQISPEQAAFMQLIVKLTGVRRALEVGTFTGYSALAVAEAMDSDGRLIACDVSVEWTSIGKPHWAKAGVAHKIDLRIGPAADTLRALPEGDQFDLAFIDADKGNYSVYFEEILRRLRTGGVLMVDNTIWSGKVVAPEPDDADSVALAAFNDALAADERVDVVLLTLGDGLTLAQKR